MHYIGIDLSGPSNPKDTVLVHFKKEKSTLQFIDHMSPLNDKQLITYIQKLAQTNPVTIGMDAPLSYEDGGGDRERDRDLRRFIRKIGMNGSSIMPPTMMRMVYLTLRGIRLSREIGSLTNLQDINIVEVHPGAALGARVNSVDDVLRYKKDLSTREKICRWFGSQQLKGVPNTMANESHRMDACAAALAAWHWRDDDQDPKWLYKASPPLHPYDFCC